MTDFTTGMPSSGTGAINSRITKKTLQALAPLPDTALRLLALLDDPNVSLREVADVAVRDVGISATMLRMANSVMFGLRGRVGSISDALRVIGTMQARLLVLASGVSEAARKELPLYELAAGSFLRHSELVGNLTMYIAREMGYANIGSAYSAGLLHDIGKIVINGVAQQSTEGRVASLAQEMEARHISLLQLEQADYGKDHAQIGKELAEMWSLPPELGQAIALHHDVGLTPNDENLLACCVAVANAVAGVVDPEYSLLNRVSVEGLPHLIDEDKIYQSAEQFLREAEKSS